MGFAGVIVWVDGGARANQAQTKAQTDYGKDFEQIGWHVANGLIQDVNGARLYPETANIDAKPDAVFSWKTDKKVLKPAG